MRLVYGIQVNQDVYLTEEFTDAAGGEREAVNLRTARVGGAFDFNPTKLESAVGGGSEPSQIHALADLQAVRAQRGAGVVMHG